MRDKHSPHTDATKTEVLRYLGEGMSIAAVSRKTGISPLTIRTWRDPNVAKWRRNWASKWRKENPKAAWASTAMSNIRKRVKNKNVKVDINAEYLLEIFPADNKCPILRSTFVFQTGTKGPVDRSPSVDRLNPKKGYTPGNVVVISAKANAIKNNATPAELMTVATWSKKHT